jgi:hypothetical protein
MSNILIIEAVDGPALRSVVHHGKTYYGGQLGQRYRVVVSNRYSTRTEFVITVDGRNVIDNEPGSVSGSGYIIPPRASSPIDGWRTSTSEVAVFRLAAAEQSYAAQSGDASNVGVIGVAVWLEKVRPTPARAPSPTPASRMLGGGVTRSSRAGGSSADGATLQSMGAGTAFGEAATSRVATTTFERGADSPNETAVIYYDTVENLIARGILPADNGANPFPADTDQSFCKRP